MGKRSDGDFERVPNDLYRTWDYRAVRPLLPFLNPGTQFVEPCAGHGDLIDQLTIAGHKLVRAYDIDPKRDDIHKGDARTLRWNTVNGVWVTNPPWSRDLLHPIIRNLCTQAPLWAIFDADWLYTSQSIPLLIYLRKVVAIGRVRWIKGSDADGKDNVAAYLFDGTTPRRGPIEFHGRT